jgi:hypothetical protein
MLKSETCPCCNATASRRWPALVSPFTADYVLHAPPSTCQLLECGRCGHRYFDLRYSAEELERLYAGYREESYFACRNRHEPWYTEAVNRFVGWDEGLVASRRAGIAAFLGRAGLPGPVGSVLDYGGDSGQLIPPGIAREAFVFDLSGVTPMPGVTGLRREADLRAGAYDLVLLSHVLEHAPDPRDLLEKVAPLLPHGSGALYVEVPLERPWLGLLPRGRAGKAWLDSVRRLPRVLRALDFYSTAFRVKAGFLPPLGFAKLHEHVNAFTRSSLSRALENAGFAVLRLEETSRRNWPTGPALVCLARPAVR